MRVVGREDLLYQVRGGAVALQGNIPDVKLQVPMDPESPRVFASLTLLLPLVFTAIFILLYMTFRCRRSYTPQEFSDDAYPEFTLVAIRTEPILFDRDASKL
jgi:hypothetical protein